MVQLPLLHDPAPQADENTNALVSVAVPPLDGDLLYSFNRATHPNLSVGTIVHVHLGKRVVPGFVISVDSEREEQSALEMRNRKIKVKPISGPSAPIKAFTEEHLTFLKWIAKYYAEPLSKILDIAVPTPAYGKADPVITIGDAIPASRLGEAQERAISYLKERSGWTRISEIRRLCNVSSATLRTLEERGYVTIARCIPEEDEGPQSKTLPEAKIEDLSSEQKAATLSILPHISERSFSSFLLHGVTGSGKTEVYLELIIEALRHGRSALIIVPEIALTPQLLNRFEARLNQEIAVLHSSLRPPQRWQHWENLLSGRAKVVIGARSAIFAPMRDIGVIVVDEEHDGSFKQGEGIRYNARDLAVVRAKLANCPIVLGSATPSLESLHHARNGKHSLLRLTTRYFNSRPLQFNMVDLNVVKPWEMPSRNISPRLLSALKETLHSGEQAFILYNRRGFATYLQCSKCEYVVGCPHCSVTLTLHRKTHALLCHFCGFTTPPPSACSCCGARETLPEATSQQSGLFTLRGSGTERVFEEIKELLPSARVAKLDRDEVRSIDDYTNLLAKVRSKEIDILVGTQMIAKGHDLPDVTLVGIVDCDVGLHVPDFRAAERAFQLLTQVAGRAGRREKQGQVILQTRAPSHPSLRMTIAENFEEFATQELKMREMLGYPPYQRLLRVIVGADDAALAEETARGVAERATQICATLEVTLLGPAPAPIEKVRSLWRFHILLKAVSAAKLQHVMERLKRELPPHKRVRMIFDLDPQDML